MFTEVHLRDVVTFNHAGWCFTNKVYQSTVPKLLLGCNAPVSSMVVLRAPLRGQARLDLSYAGQHTGYPLGRLS